MAEGKPRKKFAYDGKRRGKERAQTELSRAMLTSAQTVKCHEDAFDPADSSSISGSSGPLTGSIRGVLAWRSCRATLRTTTVGRPPRQVRPARLCARCRSKAGIQPLPATETRVAGRPIHAAKSVERHAAQIIQEVHRHRTGERSNPQPHGKRTRSTGIQDPLEQMTAKGGKRTL